MGDYKHRIQLQVIQDIVQEQIEHIMELAGQIRK